MKFLVFGNTALVRRAFASKTDAGLEVVINLNSRAAGVDIQGGSCYYAPENHELDHDTFVVTSGEDEEAEGAQAQEAELVVVCETQEEHLMMSDALRYSNQCKDQFSVLYVPRSAMLERSSLGDFSAG